MWHVAEGMLTVTVGWAATALVLVGLGCIFLRITMPASLRSAGPLDFFLAGLIGLIASLQIWHFVLPVDWRCTLFFSLLGLLGLVYMKSRTRLPQKNDKTALVTTFFFALTAVLFTSNIVLRVCENYDTGMYHINALRWINTYPVVPGLGNLSDQLGYQQSYFLFLSWLNIFPYFNHSSQVGNPLLFLAALISGLFNLVRILRAEIRPNPTQLVSILIVPVLFLHFGSFNLYGPVPGFAVLVLELLLLVKFSSLLCEAAGNGEKTSLDLLLVLALSTLLLTLKMTQAVFAFTTSLVALIFAVTRGRTLAVLPHRKMLFFRCVAISLFILVPSVARQVILTGYPLYPSTLMPFPVEWRMPEDKLSAQSDFARRWAYVTSETPTRYKTRLTLDRKLVLEGRKSLAEVKERSGDLIFIENQRLSRIVRQYAKSPKVVIPLLLLLLAGGAQVALFSRKAGFRTVRWWLPYLPAVVSLCAWAAFYPNMRFLGAILWWLALWPATAILTHLGRHASLSPPRYNFFAAILVLTFSFAALNCYPPRIVRQTEPGGFPSWPEVPMETWSTRSGLKCYVPKSGVKVYDGPLPTTPYVLNPDLELRELQKGLREGFLDASLPRAE